MPLAGEGAGLGDRRLAEILRGPIRLARHIAVQEVGVLLRGERLVSEKRQRLCRRCPVPPRGTLLKPNDRTSRWIELKLEVPGRDRLRRIAFRYPRKGRRRGLQRLQARRRLALQRRRQRADAFVKVGPLLCPALLHDEVAGLIEHRGQIARAVMVVVKVGLCVGAPRMLCGQQKLAQQAEIDSVAARKASLRNPRLT